LGVGLGPVLALTPRGDADAQAAEGDDEQGAHDGQGNDQLQQREAAFAATAHQRGAGTGGVPGVAGREPGVGVVGVVATTVSGIVRSMLTST